MLLICDQPSSVLTLNFCRTEAFKKVSFMGKLFFVLEKIRYVHFVSKGMFTFYMEFYNALSSIKTQLFVCVFLAVGMGINESEKIILLCTN